MQDFSYYVILNIFAIALLSVLVYMHVKHRRDSIRSFDCDKVTTLVENWVAAMSSHNSDKLIALYLENAVLLPTYSPKIISNQQDRKEYFNILLSRRNLSVVISKTKTYVFNEISISNGIYTFHYINDDNVEISVSARFTFVCKKTYEGWFIMTHHSSVLPS
jgi:uncharacterized protein (TIGR02246 family)